MYGNHAPTLRNLALKVISQTAYSSACEINWSTFVIVHTKQRNQLAYPRLQQLVFFFFFYYNMKLKICDMQTETNRVAERITLIYSTFQPSLVKKRIINYSKGLDLSIWMMKMEIMIHELLL